MSLFRVLYDILVQDGWEFDFDKKNEIIKLEVRGFSTSFYSYLFVDEEQESLLCNTHIREKIPSGKRLEVCDFMSRVNYELANGNFEMDMDNGEIRYRTYLDLKDAEPSKEQILNILWNSVLGFDTYYPGLMKLVYCDYSAKEAAALCTEQYN